MTEKKIKKWITVRGVHVPIYDGENTRQAIHREFGNKDITEEYQENYWKDINGKPAHKKKFSFGDNDGHITIMERTDTNTNNIFEYYTKPEKRGQGIGTKLLSKAVGYYKGNLSGQFSSETSVKNAYKLGFRTQNNDDLKSTLKIQAEYSSVYMKYKKKHRR